jgi:hypothetical protein
MPAYDRTQFDPPAPLASVTLRNPHTGAISQDVPMLLDSGADVSLIPRFALAQSGITPIPNTLYELIGFDGSKSLAPVVHVEMIFCSRIFRGRFLLIDQTLGILGRNVLNSVAIFFDGPNLTWDQMRP